MNIYGAFLCIHPEGPRVVLLDAEAMTRLNERTSLAARHPDNPEFQARAYALAFGAGVTHAIPAWSRDAMALIAKGYTGDHEARVRGLAACIATGRAYGGPEGRQGGDDGGRKVPADPGPAPGKGPSGAAVRPIARKATTADRARFAAAGIGAGA